jgi:hypothetical protein
VTGQKYRRFAFEHALDRVDGLPARARCTGVVLAHFMGDDGRVWVGQRRLRDGYGIGAKRLRGDVEHLAGVGLLEVSARSGPHGSTLYRSLAAFIGDTADVVLANGTVLPARASGLALSVDSARASGHALESDAVEPARASGHALTEVPSEGSARAFEHSARAFDDSARASGHANHHTTTPPLGGGGGGGGAVPAAAPADAAATGPAWQDVGLVLDGLATAFGDQWKVPQLHAGLNDEIRAKYAAGWTAEQVVAVAADSSLPAKVGDLGALLAGRLRKVTEAPTITPQRPTTATTAPTTAPEPTTELADGPTLLDVWRGLVYVAFEIGGMENVNYGGGLEVVAERALAAIDVLNRETDVGGRYPGFYMLEPEKLRGVCLRLIGAPPDDLAGEIGALTTYLRECLPGTHPPGTLDEWQQLEVRQAIEAASWAELVQLAGGMPYDYALPLMEVVDAMGSPVAFHSDDCPRCGSRRDCAHRGRS